MCNQQEQLRQLPYPVPIGLRQEDLDLDLEEEESGEDSEDLEEEGETLFNDDSDPMEGSSVQDQAAVNESMWALELEWDSLCCGTWIIHWPLNLWRKQHF